MNSKWKNKRQVDLELGSKGFFIAIVVCIEDFRKISLRKALIYIFEEDPYFYNSIRLYLRYWIKRFNPKKRTLKGI